MGGAGGGGYMVTRLRGWVGQEGEGTWLRG